MVRQCVLGSNILDTAIVGLFTGLTGGTVGVARQPLTWAHIINANAILSLQEFEGEVFCVLHPNQWWTLVISAFREGYRATKLAGDPVYKNLPNTYYRIDSPLSHITFIITSAIAIDADGDAVGAMYFSGAIGATMMYGVSVIHPLLGVRIISDVIAPA